MKRRRVGDYRRSGRRGHMVDQSKEMHDPQRPLRRVSMVPLHSSYPRAPYAPQKNHARSLVNPEPVKSARAPRSGQTSHSQQQGHAGARTITTGQEGEQRSRPRDRTRQATTSPRNEGQTAAQASHRHRSQTTGRPSPRMQSASTQHDGGKGPLLPSGAASPSRSSPSPSISAPTGERPTVHPRRPRATGSARTEKKRKPSFALILIIAVMAYSLIPRLVDAFTPDDPFSFPTATVDHDTGDDVVFAAPPAPLPMGDLLKYADTLPAQQSGSRETPASVGQRLQFTDVAITVENIERGEKAARAAWELAPPGYEYVLVDLRLENPHHALIDVNPLLMTDDNELLYPVLLKEGEDFRYEAQPNKEGVTVGKTLFLVKTDAFHTLLLNAYAENYPVVFYALP